MDFSEHHPTNMDEHVLNVAAWPQRFPYARDEQEEAGPDLLENGFEPVMLKDRLKPYLKEIEQHGLTGARAGFSTESNLHDGALDQSTIESRFAKALQGANTFGLRNYYNYNLKCQGFVIRKSGPMASPAASKFQGMSHNGVAVRVHVDQDLEGEPLRAMDAVRYFRAPLKFLGFKLLNLWSPLKDVRMNPMAFADMRTVDVASDLLRYRANTTAEAGGSRGSFVSDRLMPLFRERHKWYYVPDLRFGSAIAFDTGEIPHSSFTLPGEHFLLAVREKIAARECDHDALGALLKELNEDPSVVGVVREGVERAADFLATRVCSGAAEASEIEAFDDEYLTRASLEIRCMSIVVPKPVVKGALALCFTTVVFGLGFVLYGRRHDARAVAAKKNA